MASVISQILAQQKQGQKELQIAKSLFENLKDGEFEKTSDSTPKYNCIAYAAEETHRNWWPVHHTMASNDVYWPDDVPRVRSLKNFILAFETLGYKPCDSADFEEGFEKVAIYVADKPSADALKGAPLHMARQLDTGDWTSKLGGFIDISHKTLEGVTGKKYGVVKQILKRPKNEKN